MLDPSRVAAQVVSGIGFIGGGLIFVQRNNVRGLTTAAGVWATAGVGLAAGGDLPILATAATFAYLLVSVGYPYITRHMPGTDALTLTAADHLRRRRRRAAQAGGRVLALRLLDRRPLGRARGGRGWGRAQRTVTVKLALRGRGSMAQLSAELDSARRRAQRPRGRRERHGLGGALTTACGCVAPTAPLPGFGACAAGADSPIWTPTASASPMTTRSSGSSR